MKRLTKKQSPVRVDENCVSEYAIKNHNEMHIAVEISNKLGQLEDIEEETGIDLITLFKAIRKGIWYKNEQSGLILYDQISLNSTSFFMGYFIVNKEIIKIKNYGKSWGLTKEEIKEE